MPGLTKALYSAFWSRPERQLHMNVLELWAVHLTLLHLEQEIFGQTVLIEFDNMATVLYINKQGEIVSKTLNLQCPVLVMDRAVPLRLSPDRSSRENSDQDLGGSGRGGHRHRPQLARRSWYHLLLQIACKIPLLLRWRQDLRCEIVSSPP